MLREQLIKRHIGEAEDFRWRGQEVSRLEGFTDAVFAFVITLLVISTEVPKNFNDLVAAFSFSSVGSFAICFIFLVGLWHSHYVFFRRYGLEDGPIFILNTVFLFIVALYVYPLKFVFTWLLNGVPMAPVGAAITDATPIRVDQVGPLMVIYSLGIVFLYLTNMGFYLRAFHLRRELGLTDVEIHDTITSIGPSCIVIGVGTLSILIALLGGPNGASLAGIVYLLILPLTIIYRANRNRERRHLELTQNPAAAAPAS